MAQRGPRSPGAVREFFAAFAVLGRAWPRIRPVAPPSGPHAARDAARHHRRGRLRRGDHPAGGEPLEHGGLPGAEEPGFWRAFGDSGRLFWLAGFLGVALALVAIIPVVGAALAILGELILGGRIVALELTSRPLEARGLRRAERRRVLRTRNARVVGFGVAVNLCMIVPGGAPFW